MPVVHRYTSGPGLYIKASVQGRITTYQVTTAGIAYLTGLGCGEGGSIGQTELYRIIRLGHAYTGGSGPGHIETRIPVDIDTTARLPATNSTTTPISTSRPTGPAPIIGADLTEIALIILAILIGAVPTALLCIYSKGNPCCVLFLFIVWGMVIKSLMSD